MVPFFSIAGDDDEDEFMRSVETSSAAGSVPALQVVDAAVDPSDTLPSLEVGFFVVSSSFVLLFSEELLFKKDGLMDRTERIVILLARDDDDVVVPVVDETVVLFAFLPDGSSAIPFAIDDVVLVPSSPFPLLLNNRGLMDRTLLNFMVGTPILLALLLSVDGVGDGCCFETAAEEPMVLNASTTFRACEISSRGGGGSGGNAFPRPFFAVDTTALLLFLEESAFDLAMVDVDDDDAVA